METRGQRPANLHAALFEQAAVGVALAAEGTGRFLATNRRFQELLGRSAEELEGLTFLEVTQAEDREASAVCMERLLQGGMETVTFENRCLRGDGAGFWAQVTLAPFRGADGSRQGCLAILQDVGERRHLEEALRRTQEELARTVQERGAEIKSAHEELEAFLSHLSHDLRSPLQAVTSFSQFLENQPRSGLSEESRGLVARIRQAAARMDQILEDLLRWVRGGRGEQVLVFLDLADLAEQVLAGLLEAAQGRRVVFRVARPLQVRGDPRLLRQVLENLLGNALKFTAHREEAVLELGRGSEEGGFVEVFLQDNGAGFPAAQAHQLFSPFQRLHSSRAFPGTGIGLALVKRIVARHGGQVRADGEEDRGARFTFTLPSGRPS